jgi:hypothetical protein
MIINKQHRNRKSTKPTFATNSPINLIKHSPTNTHPNMVIHNLRNPIPTHRPNSPRKPYNIARRRIASLRDIAVRVLPRAVLTKNQTLARPWPRRRFQETRVSWLLRMMLAWRTAAAAVAGEIVWDWSAQRGCARHWRFCALSWVVLGGWLLWANRTGPSACLRSLSREPSFRESLVK